MHWIMTFLILCLSVVSAVRADIQVTNLNQNDDGFQAAQPGTTIAQAFITGPDHLWRLNSVRFTVEYFGFGTTDIVVRLRDYFPGIGPAATLEVLANYTLGQGEHNLILFSSGVVLQPSTRYYIAIDTNPNQVGVRVTDDNAECSLTGWLVEDYGNINTLFWPAWGTTSMRMEIDADPIIPAPIVTSVTGCTDSPPRTIDCPNSGGINLQVFGQNFTGDTIILVGGIPATNPVLISSTQINCVLPPGAGRNNPVTAVKGTDVGMLASGVSYAQPLCPGDADGDGFITFADLTATLSLFNTTCP